MPAGVSWARYLSAVGAALLSMLAGAQVVHHRYRPLDDLEARVQQEVDRRVRLRQMASHE